MMLKMKVNGRKKNLQVMTLFFGIVAVAPVLSFAQVASSILRNTAGELSDSLNEPRWIGSTLNDGEMRLGAVCLEIDSGQDTTQCTKWQWVKWNRFIATPVVKEGSLSIKTMPNLPVSEWIASQCAGSKKADIARLVSTFQGVGKNLDVSKKVFSRVSDCAETMTLNSSGNVKVLGTLVNRKTKVRIESRCTLDKGPECGTIQFTEVFPNGSKALLRSMSSEELGKRVSKYIEPVNDYFPFQSTYNLYVDDDIMFWLFPPAPIGHHLSDLLFITPIREMIDANNTRLSRRPQKDVRVLSQTKQNRVVSDNRYRAALSFILGQ